MKVTTAVRMPTTADSHIVWFIPWRFLLLLLLFFVIRTDQGTESSEGDIAGARTDDDEDSEP